MHGPPRLRQAHARQSAFVSCRPKPNPFALWQQKLGLKGAGWWSLSSADVVMEDASRAAHPLSPWSWRTLPDPIVVTIHRRRHGGTAPTRATRPLSLWLPPSPWRTPLGWFVRCHHGRGGRLQGGLSAVTMAMEDASRSKRRDRPSPSSWSAAHQRGSPDVVVAVSRRGGCL